MNVQIKGFNSKFTWSILLGAFLFFNEANAFGEGNGTDWAGINWGIGISLTHDLGSNDRVDEARVVNGIVRVEDDNNEIPRIMLETHWYFTPDNDFPLGLAKKDHWGVGPFLAIQPGGDNIVDALGFGAMLGFRRGEENQSFNFGLGAIVDPDTQILGDGIEEGKPLPAGETEVRFKKTDQWGLLALFAFSF